MRLTLLAALAALLVPLPALAETSQVETVRVWDIDTSGRPPFKRRLVEVPVADVARLESTSEPAATITRRVVDFSGRPPFRRSTQELPVIDTARLEAQANTRRDSPHPRPFHKPRHR